MIDYFDYSEYTAGGWIINRCESGSTYAITKPFDREQDAWDSAKEYNPLYADSTLH